jgi:hypothetical protein
MHASFPSGRNIITTSSSKVPWTVWSEAQSVWTVLSKLCYQNLPRVCHVSTHNGINNCTDQSAVDTWQLVPCGPSRWLPVSILTRVRLSRLHKLHEPISGHHVANGGKVYATWSMQASRNFDRNSMGAIRSKSSSRGLSDQNPILPRSCHVSDVNFQILHWPIRV